jgi:hypothetical protein
MARDKLAQDLFSAVFGKTFTMFIVLFDTGKVYYPKKICLIQGKKITSSGEKKIIIFSPV